MRFSIGKTKFNYYSPTLDVITFKSFVLLFRGSPNFSVQLFCFTMTQQSTCFSAIPAERGYNVCAVSYTHLGDHLTGSFTVSGQATNDTERVGTKFGTKT